MIGMPDNALPNYDKTEIRDPSAFYRTLFHLRDIKEERAIPGTVTDYDTKTGIVTVLPMAKYTFDTRDGEVEADRETVKVRAMKICHGGYSISIPIYKGETGWLIAGDRRCGEAIKKNDEILVRNLTEDELANKTSRPDDFSILNFENGFFIPFSWELEDAEKNPGDNFVIRNVRNQLGDKFIENEFGVVRDELGNDVPFIEEPDGRTISLDGKYRGQYAWSMVEIQKNGMVNLYGQGKKFTVRKEGLYVDDRPLTIGGGSSTPDVGAFMWDKENGLVHHVRVIVGRRIIYGQDFPLPTNFSGALYAIVDHPPTGAITVECSLDFRNNTDSVTCIKIYEMSNGVVYDDYRNTPVVPVYE